MGLDMYLDLKRYYWHGEEAPTVNEAPDGFRVKYVVLEAAYWRMANAIHQWFVDNVQGGEDDCHTYQVDRGIAERLVEVCKQVLDDHSKAPELLPTTDGFFFGSTEYDESYFQDLKDTIIQIKDALNKTSKEWFFEYHSSW